MGPVAVRRPERESATVWLTLQGGRKVSAQRLGRWPETVKVLRRNLYHPLGGATHAELFALFLQQSGEPDAAARLNPA
ncbi:hypothetical protein [Pseudomonas sp.]|uniref:hypothetical protein n=1 Tax=Pseudomonas sp. TaxID=306 RepID=UPI0035248885